MIILVFANIFFCIWYSVISQTENSSYTGLTSNKTLTSNARFVPYINQIYHNSCYLSLKESDNWFCDSDDDWKRRKRLHHIQDKRNRNNDSVNVFLQNNWEPTIHCTFEQRIGSVGDGGKWVCDVHNIQANNYVPLIYSFGSHADFSFE